MSCTVRLRWLRGRQVTPRCQKAINRPPMYPATVKVTARVALPKTLPKKIALGALE